MYTLFIGYILVNIYEKNKNLKYPIILHITLNISVIILGLIIPISNILNIILFSICILIIFIMIIKRLRLNS